LDGTDDIGDDILGVPIHDDNRHSVYPSLSANAGSESVSSYSEVPGSSGCDVVEHGAVGWSASLLLA
jgi:hypothetical protein